MAVYNFRVLLDNSDDKKIFRDILIESSDNFKSFYQTIIESFDFEGKQLASFYMSNENWDKGQEITLMDMSFGESEISSMDDSIIEDFVEHSNQKILLVYDFLNMWIFLIELQDILEVTTHHLPHCNLKVGEALSENSRSININEFLEESNFDTLKEFEDNYEDDFDDDIHFDNIDDYDI